jgi:hypothetical protein
LDEAAVLAGVVAKGLKEAGQKKVTISSSPANSKGNAEFYGMLRLPKMPSVILECAFIDNPANRALVDTIYEQKVFGICVADAIAINYGSKILDSYGEAICVLHDKGIISSPDYWEQFKYSTRYAKGEYVAAVLTKATKSKNIKSAVNSLAKRKLLLSPDYWIQNCSDGCYVYGIYLQSLFINLLKIIK